MAIKVEKFGLMPDGTQVDRYTLTNENGVHASFTNLGGTWISMYVPDRNGALQDVILGFDTVEGYLANPPHFGAVIGRHANRIAGASFDLNGTHYELAANNGPNNLHSGPDFYHGRIWEVELGEGEEGSSVAFSLESPHMDQGFPGNAKITVTYTLTRDNAVRLDYHMTCDQDTIANFTNHCYFNLAGQGCPDILEQQVWIDADFFTPADAVSIPTGEIASVKGTPMDFTSMKPIGRDLEAEYEPLILGKGYDHNWVLNHRPGACALSARAYDPSTGRTMEVYTDLPGVQFYTANFLTDAYAGKGGKPYGRRFAYCFETQYYPDSVHKDNFPSVVLPAGREYKTTTIYKFMVTV